MAPRKTRTYSWAVRQPIPVPSTFLHGRLLSALSQASFGHFSAGGASNLYSATVVLKRSVPHRVDLRTLLHFVRFSVVMAQADCYSDSNNYCDARNGETGVSDGTRKSSKGLAQEGVAVSVVKSIRQ